MIEAAGHQLRKPIRQPHCLRMIDPTEHHVRHAVGLIHDRIDDVRMAMAVAGSPPRREGVDDSLARLQFQPHALGGDDMQRLAHRSHLAVGPPERHAGEPVELRPRVHSPGAHGSPIRDGFVT